MVHEETQPVITARHPTIVSLFDYSGRWSEPWVVNGFNVIRVDIKRGVDVMTWSLPSECVCVWLLAAPPCTHFASSGAQYWAQKDSDGRTEQALALVHRTMDIVNELRPKFWILENPVGRLPKFIGPYEVKVHPYMFAGYSPNPQEDRYTKATCLWGDFDLPEPKPLPPLRVCRQGSWLQRLGGSSERTKELRSMTPLGFAWACYYGNLHRVNG